MSITQDFYTNALYPGGDGECGIGTHDPYPDEIPDGNIFKVNISAERFRQLSWNLEEWDAFLAFRLEASDLAEVATSFAPDDVIVAARVEGQFSKIQEAFYVDNDEIYLSPIQEDVYVLLGEPSERICGRCARQRGLTPTRTIESIPLILPEVRLLYGFGGFDSPNVISASYDVKDPDENIVGDVTVTSLESWTDEVEYSVQTSTTPIYARLMSDGSVDVYVEVVFNGHAVTLKNFNTPTDERISSYVLINILGVEVDAYLWHPTEGVITTFELTYDVNVTTAYTYA